RRWIGEAAVYLASFHTKDVVCLGSMAGQAISRAWVKPGLSSDPDGVGDNDRFVQAGGEQVSLAVVGTPFIGYAINCAVDVANDQTGFEPAFVSGDLVGHQLKILHKNGAGGERPFAIGGEGDLFVRGVRSAVVGDG